MLNPTQFRLGLFIGLMPTLLTFSLTQAFAAPKAPVLVELFTSEGCSDCPPAESFLRALDQTQPVRGEQLIVLEEHVDYWDDQGWKDPFSSHQFSTRQTQYVGRLDPSRGQYTPQMIVDGTESFVGSDRAEAARAFQRQVSVPKINVDISSVHSEAGRLSLHVSTAESPAKAEVLLALALDHAESQVVRGENGGKRLEHVAVVKGMTKIGELKKGEQLSKDVKLAIENSQEPHRIVVFLQQPNEGKILGAAVSHIP